MKQTELKLSIARRSWRPYQLRNYVHRLEREVMVLNMALEA